MMLEESAYINVRIDRIGIVKYYFYAHRDHFPRADQFNLGDVVSFDGIKYMCVPNNDNNNTWLALEEFTLEASLNEACNARISRNDITRILMHTTNTIWRDEFEFWINQVAHMPNQLAINQRDTKDEEQVNPKWTQLLEE